MTERPSFSTTEDFIKPDAADGYGGEAVLTEELWKGKSASSMKKSRCIRQSGYRLYFDTIGQMYDELPVKIDIAGNCRR